ncbi:MAG: hypothetical protein RLY21_569 [Planctomycetota bacterium]
MSNDAIILCPYCGNRQAFATACGACGGRFDAWSLAATQNDMGAWFVRDSKRPHFVGYSYATLVAAIRAGEVGRDAIVRGPSTRQFWTVARRAAGLAHLFGRCHACQGPMTAEEADCGACGVSAYDWQDRNYLGLPPVEAVAQPSASLDAQALVHSAFVREGSVYFVRTSPVPPPTSMVVRVTPPAAVATSPQTLAVLEPALPAPVTASSAAPTAPAPSEASPPRGGLSQVDRSLASRVRRLERINQILFLATVFAGLLALVLGGAYVVQRDMRSKEIAAARDEAIREVRAEFERAQPVTKPKVVDLPSEPEPPPAQVGAPSAAPPIRR